MSQNDATFHCLNCGKSEKEIPLVNLRYNGAQNWICSRCIPVLIHKPYQLAEKLAGAENIPPAEHNH